MEQKVTYLTLLEHLKVDDCLIADRRTSLQLASIKDSIDSGQCFYLYFYSLFVSFSITVFFVAVLFRPFQIAVDMSLYSSMLTSNKEIVKVFLA